MELNPRAAYIAELVLWIGHLQWHARTKGGMPSEPILRAFKNIVVKDAVLVANKSPHRPDWPPAEFIVGNPPFIGGKDLRARLGDEYALALWAAHKHMNESADFVMYWWDHAADLLTRKGTALRRFGLVTTNSLSQVFQRRVIEPHLAAKKSDVDCRTVRIASGPRRSDFWRSAVERTCPHSSRSGSMTVATTSRSTYARGV
jgi:hypothetical protein